MRVPKDCACQKNKRLMKDGIKRMVNKLEQDPLKTGLTAPYEQPENPELIVDTSLIPVNKCVDQLIDFLIVSKSIFSNSRNGNSPLGNT